MRIPSAMGRSNRPPSLGRSAGARFTVIRPAGNSKRELRSAARTRSLLSFTTVAGRPTIQNVVSLLLLRHGTRAGGDREMSVHEHTGTNDRLAFMRAYLLALAQ